MTPTRAAGTQWACLDIDAGGQVCYPPQHQCPCQAACQGHTVQPGPPQGWRCRGCAHVHGCVRIRQPSTQVCAFRGVVPSRSGAGNTGGSLGVGALYVSVLVLVATAHVCGASFSPCQWQGYQHAACVLAASLSPSIFCARSLFLA